MTRADLPVGAYLSGGLDSSLIAATAFRTAGSRLRTYSVRFADRHYDETEHQRRMVSHLGTNHVDTLVSNADIGRVFPEVILHTERPVLRTAAAPLFLLSRLVSQSGIKVVLSGEGADEMFAGYDLFREAKVRRFWAREPDSTSRPGLLSVCTHIWNARRSRDPRSPGSSLARGSTGSRSQASDTIHAGAVRAR